MKNQVICSLILLAIALNYGAIAQVDLSGANGESVLTELTTPGLTINTSANGSPENASSVSPLNQSEQMLSSQQVLTGDLGGWLSS